MFGMGKKIDAHKISQELKSGDAILVDVREDDEWHMGHAQDAMHLSLSHIMHGEVPTKDTNKKVYVYCASGNRSGMATNYLQGRGLKVENIGGLSNWTRSGGAVERG